MKTASDILLPTKKTVFRLVFCFSFFLIQSYERASCGLEITSPRPGEVVYQDEGLFCRAAWSGGLPARGENLRYLWSSNQDGPLGEGLDKRFSNLSYSQHILTAQALLGDSVMAVAETKFTVIMRPVQFTLAERNDWEGEFSPQGDRTAFTSFRSGEAEIWISSSDGRATNRITYQGGIGPSWSPDGRAMVFWGERVGGRHLWLVDLGAVSANAIQLTSGEESNWLPAFSPVDNRVVFVSKLNKRFCLKIINTAEPEPKAVEILGPEHKPMFPRWFPDGKEILFTSYRDTLPVICRLSLDTGAVVQVTAPGAEDADISRDGKNVAMVRDGELWLHRMSENSERPLTRERSGIISPRFSPDSGKIIYSSSRSGNYDLWILDLPR